MKTERYVWLVAALFFAAMAVEEREAVSNRSLTVNVLQRVAAYSDEICHKADVYKTEFFVKIGHLVVFDRNNIENLGRRKFTSHSLTSKASF